MTSRPHLPALAIAPRTIWFRDAFTYLGMDRNRFNAEVRPYLTEVPIGKQGIGFDRLELDAWFEAYTSCSGRPARKGSNTLDANNTPASSSRPGSRISTSASADGEFAKALARLKSKKPRPTSRDCGTDPTSSSLWHPTSRTFEQAAAKFVSENQHKRSIVDALSRLKGLIPWPGAYQLDRIHTGTLQPWGAQRLKDGVATGTINQGLQIVRRILNLASGEWVDEFGLTWLHAAPKVKLLPKTDAR